jgi:hypothetical protein
MNEVVQAFGLASDQLASSAQLDDAAIPCAGLISKPAPVGFI